MLQSSRLMQIFARFSLLRKSGSSCCKFSSSSKSESISKTDELSSITQTSVTSIRESWWSRFRRELREEFEPLPTPPGYVNTSLLDLEKWESVPPEVVRESFKRAFVEVTGDWVDAWKWLRGRYTEEALEEEEKRRKKKEEEEEEEEAGKVQNDNNVDQDVNGLLSARLRASERIEFPTADGIRSAAAESLKRVKNLSADEELKGRVAGVVADGLKVARDSLDEFLIGFEEGKAQEEKKQMVEQKEEEERRNTR
jgi:hypothetical protein